MPPHSESENTHTKIRHLNVFRPFWSHTWELNRLLEANSYSHASPRNGHVQVIQNYLLFIILVICSGLFFAFVMLASSSDYNRRVFCHFDEKGVTVDNPAI